MSEEIVKANETEINVKPKKKKIQYITIPVLLVVLSAALLLTSNSRKYNKAVRLYNNKSYDTACILFESLKDYEESEHYLEKCRAYIDFLNFKNVENYEEAVSVIEEQKLLLSDDEDYLDILNECKYLLAEQQFVNKEYVKANNNLTDNNYNKVDDLKRKIQPHYESEKAVDEIIETYQWMSDYLDKTYVGVDYHTSNVFSSFGIDWDMFYQNKCSELDKLEKKLKTEPFDECKSYIEDFMGYVPKDKKTCDIIITELKETFVYTDSISDYESYLIPYVMDFLSAQNKYTKIEKNDVEAVITIKEVNKYLKSKNISAKTFAYMLGLPAMYGMDITKHDETLQIKFLKSSHCWSWCDSSELSEEEEEKLKKEINAIVDKAIANSIFLYTSNGTDYYEIDLSGLIKYNLPYFRIAFLGSDLNDQNKLLSQNHHFLDENDLKESSIKITAEYDRKCKYTGYWWATDTEYRNNK